MGDKVTHWNGILMMESRDGKLQRRLLKDVVTPADSHTVIVERASKQWETTSWESNFGGSTYYTKKPAWDSNSW